MSEDQQKDARPLTREEQIKRMLPAMRKLLPTVVQAAAMYHQAYPPEKTSPDVLNAVTVAVPLRPFLLMVALVTNLVVMDNEKAAEGKFENADAEGKNAETPGAA